MPPSRGSIHVYYNKVQTVSSLKPLDTKHLYEEGTNAFINNQGHMTKMTVMPICGKNPSKLFYSRTAELISTKLGM